MTDLANRHRAVLPTWMGLYYEHPLELVSGSGSRVTDASGRSYLDFFCGILTNMLGYDLPEVRDAVARQLSTGIVHTSTLYLIRSQVELAEKLARLSGISGAKVFFTNSGTEANETALMLATAARQSNQVLAMRGSYHGRSFGAVAITGNVAWKSSQLAPFNVQYLHGTDRYLPAFAGMSDAEYIEACAADLKHLLTAATPRDVACLIAEPIQGVGGFTMAPDGLLGAYRDLLAEDGVPGNGISTFGGNPLSTTAANAALDYVLDHDLQRNAATLGTMIIDGLREATAPLAAVGEVRGKGLMFAVDLVDPATGAPSPALATRALEEARERGLLIGKGGLQGHALRMAPPMNITEADAKEGMGLLIDALRAVDAGAGK